MKTCETCGDYVGGSFDCQQSVCGYHKKEENLEVRFTEKHATALVKKVSIAGWDDKVSVDYIENALAKYPALEIGLLYFLEKQGTDRNPSLETRKKILEIAPKDRVCAHLCGELIFEKILEDSFSSSEEWMELSRYGRLQLNINARKNTFSQKNVHVIYAKLLSLGSTLILQYNEDSADCITAFLDKLTMKAKKFINLLVDASKGKGITLDPGYCDTVYRKFKNEYFIAFAGGINSENIEPLTYALLSKGISPEIGLDLESGVRDEKGQLSRQKVNELFGDK